MKKVLILVLSCETPPYNKMVDTSKQTWDSIEVDGVETVYYFGVSHYKRTDLNCVYLPVKESLETMGEKTVQALEYALNNYEFDYIARINSSCYVDKKKLLIYAQSLQKDNLFEGLVVADNPKWMVGAGQFLISRDVIQSFIDNKHKWRHDLMEDVAMSYLANDLNIPYSNGNACSLNKKDLGWLLISYGFTGSIEFNNFEDLSNCPHYFYRVKCDLQRHLDKYLMENLFRILK